MSRPEPITSDPVSSDEPAAGADTAAGADGRRPSIGEIEAYAAALRRAVVQALAPLVPTGGFGVDDIAQEVVLTFLHDPLSIMATYREPWIYARASTASRSIDLGRRDRAQRGEGSRLVPTADGFRPRRTAVSLDAGPPDVAATVSGGSGGHSDGVGDTATDRVTLDLLLAGLDDHERWLLECVHILEYSVTEMAEMVGQSRETVSRRLSSVQRSLREQVAP